MSLCHGVRDRACVKISSSRCSTSGAPWIFTQDCAQLLHEQLVVEDVGGFEPIARAATAATPDSCTHSRSVCVRVHRNWSSWKRPPVPAACACSSHNGPGSARFSRPPRGAPRPKRGLAGPASLAAPSRRKAAAVASSTTEAASMRGQALPESAASGRALVVQGGGHAHVRACLQARTPCPRGRPSGLICYRCRDVRGACPFQRWRRGRVAPSLPLSALQKALRAVLLVTRPGAVNLAARLTRVDLEHEFQRLRVGLLDARSRLHRTKLCLLCGWPSQA